MIYLSCEKNENKQKVAVFGTFLLKEKLWIFLDIFELAKFARAWRLTTGFSPEIISLFLHLSFNFFLSLSSFLSILHTSLYQSFYQPNSKLSFFLVKYFISHSLALFYLAFSLVQQPPFNRQRL